MYRVLGWIEVKIIEFKTSSKVCLRKTRRKKKKKENVERNVIFLHPHDGKKDDAKSQNLSGFIDFCGRRQIVFRNFLLFQSEGVSLEIGSLETKLKGSRIC